MQPASPLVHRVALSLIPNLGRRTLDNLLERFGSLPDIFAASEDALLTVPNIGPKRAAAIRAIDLEHTGQAIVTWQAEGLTLLLHNNGTPYPAALTALPDAPPLLFLRGTLPPADTRAVAIVGTRRPTDTARTLAGQLAEQVAAQGWTVVSGLATGIDTAAHTGALRAGGRTVAVLGCGLRTIYPPGNAALAAQITGHGALLSEVHPDAPPHSAALVARNRLISGLSCALVVIEAGATSGSLHAARFARAQQRPVYAVESPAPGNRHLLANGARPLAPDPATWAAFFWEVAAEC